MAPLSASCYHNYRSWKEINKHHKKSIQTKSSNDDSNGNASETKANESFDNGVFFNIEAKRTPSIVNKLFSKRSEHISLNKNYFRSEANKFDSKPTVFKAKTKMSDSKKIIFEANTLDRKQIIFVAKRTH